MHSDGGYVEQAEIMMLAQASSIWKAEGKNQLLIKPVPYTLEDAFAFARGLSLLFTRKCFAGFVQYIAVASPRQ